MPIASLRARYPAAFIIAYPHWGSNYLYAAQRQKDLAQAIIDAGADLIVGHGSHMLQEIELYRGRWIVYGIGNFVYNSPGRYSRHEVLPFGLLARLLIQALDGQPVISLQLFPTCTDNEKTGYQSHPVTDRQFGQLIDFYMPHRGERTGLERRLRAGRNGHGLYLSCDIAPLQDAD